MTVRYRATLSYDGTAYQGFQRQSGDAPTIQGVLEAAIAAVTTQNVTVIGAGRTDTGVHATGQVIAFDVAWKHGDDDLLRALNATLPDDIALQEITQQPGFHPRFDAVSRLYRYTIVEAVHRQPLLRRQSWHVLPVLDIETMQTAADCLIGEHDFATFGNPPHGTESTIRTVFQSNWEIREAGYGRMLIYTIEANAFLHHMVRHVVSTLVRVGEGKLTLDGFREIFQSADITRSVKRMAPPQGLVLEAVRYHR